MKRNTAPTNTTGQVKPSPLHCGVDNKWYVSVEAQNDNRFHRYLHPKGQWDLMAHYYDTEAEAAEALKNYPAPKFFASEVEVAAADSYDLMRQRDMERSMLERMLER